MVVASTHRLMLDHTAAERLCEGFWRQVRADLDAGCPETRAWLTSDDFAWWAAWSFGDLITVAEVRAMLLTAPPLPRRKTCQAA